MHESGSVAVEVSESVQNDAIAQEAGAAMISYAECDVSRVYEVAVPSSTVSSISEFLCGINLEQLVHIFEAEMIDLETLKEMTHEDLISVGVKAFGHRHKILKEVRTRKSNNVVQAIAQESLAHMIHPDDKENESQDSIYLGCDSCDSIFKSISDLTAHSLSHTTRENTRYGAGILFDDIRLPVQTLDNSNLENTAESTRLNSSSLQVTVSENVELIMDLPHKKRKRGECIKDRVKKLRYRLD